MWARGTNQDTSLTYSLNGTIALTYGYATNDVWCSAPIHFTHIFCDKVPSKTEPYTHNEGIWMFLKDMRQHLTEVTRVACKYSKQAQVQ